VTFKTTLLCVPVVKRLIPDNYDLEDTGEIAPYAKITGLCLVAEQCEVRVSSSMRLTARARLGFRECRGTGEWHCDEKCVSRYKFLEVAKNPIPENLGPKPLYSRKR
jgi:hypothetical protein